MILCILVGDVRALQSACCVGCGGWVSYTAFLMETFMVASFAVRALFERTSSEQLHLIAMLELADYPFDATAVCL
jgi:hypothetical protein